MHEQEGGGILRERLAEAEYRLDELMQEGPNPSPSPNPSPNPNPTPTPNPNPTPNPSPNQGAPTQPPQPLRRTSSRASFSFVGSRRSQSQDLGGGVRVVGEEGEGGGNWREAALERAGQY